MRSLTNSSVGNSWALLATLLCGALALWMNGGERPAIQPRAAPNDWVKWGDVNDVLLSPPGPVGHSAKEVFALTGEPHGWIETEASRLHLYMGQEGDMRGVPTATSWLWWTPLGHCREVLVGRDGRVIEVNPNIATRLFMVGPATKDLKGRRVPGRTSDDRPRSWTAFVRETKEFVPSIADWK